MSGDWLELGTPHEEGTFDLVVFGKDHRILAIVKNVTADPVRYYGTWTVPCSQEPYGKIDIIFEENKVSHFGVFNFRAYDDTLEENAEKGSDTVPPANEKDEDMSDNAAGGKESFVHDSLCPTPCCSWIENCRCQCDCDRTSVVRENERQHLATEILKHKQRGYTCECDAEVNNYEQHLAHVIRDAGGTRPPQG